MFWVHFFFIKYWLDFPVFFMSNDFFFGQWAIWIGCILETEFCCVPLKSNFWFYMWLPWPDLNPNLTPTASICCFLNGLPGVSPRHLYLSNKPRILVDFISDLKAHSFCGSPPDVHTQLSGCSSIPKFYLWNLFSSQ